MFSNIFVKKINNEEIAHGLLNYVLTGEISNKEVKNIVNKYTKTGEQYPDRQDILLNIVDLIKEPITSMERYLVARAYLWSRYPFKLKGIEYGNLYLNNELWEIEYSTIAVPFNIKEDIMVKKNIHIANILHEIAKIYESEYKFEEALNNYNKEIELVPFWSIGYIDKANVLIKMGKNEQALNTLKEARKSQYYEPCSTKRYEWETEQMDSTFKEVIEKNINEIQRKIDKNYKYRPRPSKCIFTKNEYKERSELQKKYLQEYIEKGIVEIK